MVKASFGLQLKLLYWKNWLFTKRSPIKTTIEIIIPVLLLIVLVGLRTLSKTETTPAVVYCSQAILPDDITRVYYPPFDKTFDTPANGEANYLCDADPLAISRFNSTMASFQGAYSAIAYAPASNPNVEAIATAFVADLAKLGVTVTAMGYPDDKALDEAATLDGKIGLGVVFYSDDGGSAGDVGYTANAVHYTLRVRQPSGFSGALDTTTLYPSFETVGPELQYTSGYFQSTGFVTFQALIDRTIVRVEGGEDPQVFPRLRPMSWPEYSQDLFALAIRSFLPLVLLLSFISPVSGIVYGLVYEKENRLKEAMKMMGLSEFVHWLAWFLKCLSYFSITVIMMTIVFGVGKIMPNTSLGVVFILFCLNMVAAICFGFFLSTLFNKATLAAFVGGLLFYAAYVPYSFVARDLEGLSNSAKAGLCLLAPSCIGVASDILSTFEGRGEGLRFDNLSANPTTVDEFSMADVFGMLILDIFLYLFLTWYISNVFPGQYGIPKPFYFFLTKSYWKGAKAVADDHHTSTPQDGALFEPTPPGAPKGIEVKNLRKVFKAETGGTKVAVDNLSMDILENQITALLGHNGAGKTTTLSMLVGLFPPTSGTATVAGKNVLTDTEGVRASLGLCPQFNVLFGVLTVAEHIMFFSRLKGLSVQEARGEITKYAAELDLENKVDDKASTLSGGQQRALSVGIALCGDSKVVILDEPTSGMDVFKRRQTWNLLLKHKVGRTLVLTTHFMEEADLLGDRIAIMAEGQLKTMGSSLFLKQKFGIGYHMTVVKKDGCHGDLVMNKINEIVPNAALQTNVGTELSLILPKEDTKKFPTMFEMLDSSKEDLKISSYGVSATTMEEVFLKVARGSLAFDDGQASDQGHAVDISDANHLLGTGGSSTRLQLLGGLSLLWLQTKAMFTKRAIYSLRNKWNLVTQILLPLFFVIVALSLAAISERVTSNPSLKVDITTYRAQTIRLTGTDTAGDIYTQIKNTSAALVADLASHQSSAQSTLLSGFRDHLSSAGSTVTLMETSSANVSDALLMASSNYQRDGFFRSNLLAISLEAGPVTIAYDANADACGVVTHAGTIDTTPLSLQKDSSYAFKVVNTSDTDTLHLSELNTSRTNGINLLAAPSDPNVFVGTTIPPNRVFTISNDDAFISRYASEMYLFCGPGSETPLTIDFDAMVTSEFLSTAVYVEYSPKAIHSPAVATNVIANVMARAYVAPSMSIKTYNNPLPKSALDSVDDIQSNGLGFAVGLNMMFAAGFLAGSFVLFIVNERISKAKHIQFVSGVAPVTFWLASYVWDFLTTIPSAIGVVIIIAAYNVDAYKGVYGEVFLVYILAMFAAIPFVYVHSFLFKTPSSAYGTISIMGMFVGLIGILAIFLAPILGSQSIGDIFRYVFLLLPNVALGQGIYDIWLNSQYKMLYNEFSQACDALNGFSGTVPDDVQSALSFCSLYKPNYIAWEEPGIGKIVLYTILSGLFWFGILMLIEYGYLRFLTLKPFVTPARSEDDDVADERSRIEGNWGSWAKATHGDDPEGTRSGTRAPKSQHEQIVMTTIDDSDLLSASFTSEHASVDAHYANEHNHIAVRDLTKLFKKGSACKAKEKFTAVDHISFGVPEGQCFGLLGVNGAGKTTTFGMLTGELQPSDGQIIAAGYNLSNQLTLARQHMGYCPQFDALVGLLTGREHIEMYAKIRGVPPEKTAAVVDTLINNLGLSKHASKPCYTYSGGNKRKLSTAIALVGSPDIVLLDEPTTGMDPEARRFLWSVLEKVTAAGQSIILTSHSMEECEALCHRLAIMVNGKLRCIGSPGHLKYKFAKGAKVQAKLKPKEDGSVGPTDALKEYLESNIHGMKLVEEYNGAVTYRVVNEEMKWGYVFDILEKAQETFSLEDYGLSEVSLEEVFLRFAAEQHTDELERQGVFAAEPAQQ